MSDYDINKLLSQLGRLDKNHKKTELLAADQSLYDENMLMLRALLPFLRNGYEQGLFVLIKALELRNALRLSQQESSMIEQEENFSRQDILSCLADYLPEKESDLLRQLIAFMDLSTFLPFHHNKPPQNDYSVFIDIINKALREKELDLNGNKESR